jgi:2-dehydropantoate 2-reductase
MGTPLSVGIIGGGNIGTAMAALLARAGAEVTLAARGERLAALRAQGVTLLDRGTRITARVEAVPALTRPVDALVPCVKAHHLAAAVAANRAAITPATLVVPMVNGLPFWFFAGPCGIGTVPGLDPDGVLAANLNPAQVLGAVLLMTVQMDGAGFALSSNTPTLGLGPVAPGADAARIGRLVTCLGAGGVRAEHSSDIRRKVLVKLLANIATNPLTALTGATLREVGTDPRMRAVAMRLAAEVRVWAAGLGHTLPGDTWLVDLLIDAGDFPTSMLQDARAGRPLELDAICRAPLALARQAGGDMPLLARLLAAIEAEPRLPVGPARVAAVLEALLSRGEAAFGTDRVG